MDIILLDLKFPHRYNGCDIYAMLRGEPLLEKIPIVMLSAADATAEIPKACLLGFSSYMTKPIDSDRFARQLKDIMDGQAIWTISL